MKEEINSASVLSDFFWILRIKAHEKRKELLKSKK
jgi:hypothetical protein